LWVAVGQGTNTIAYSSNGTTWTGVVSSPFSGQGRFVAWNGIIFLACGNGTNTIANSKDGINWNGSGNILFGIGRSLAWSGNIWVAVGDSGANTIAYSYDGIIWTGIGTLIYASAAYCVYWNGTMFVVGGLAANTMAYSYNGITWTVVTPSLGFQWTQTVAFNNRRENMITFTGGGSKTGVISMPVNPLILNDPSNNQLDIIASDGYYNSGFSNFSAQITSTFI
jgi:hypothetical protein